MKSPISTLKTALTLLCLLCALAFGQGAAPRIAVYVTGLESEAEREILASEFLSALVQSKKYVPIERGAAFLSEVVKENLTQMSGAVDDDQIISTGRRFGAEFLCVVRVASAFGVKRVTASIINVESTEVVATGNADSQLSGISDVKEVSNKIVGAILEGVVRVPVVAEQIFTDTRDGKNYRTAEIGGAVWFLQELNYGGDKFSHRGAKGACPAGWRLPTNSDWNALAASWSEGVRLAFTRTSGGFWWSATAEDYSVRDGALKTRSVYKNGEAYFFYVNKNGRVDGARDRVDCNNRSSCNPKYYVRCVKN